MFTRSDLLLGRRLSSTGAVGKKTPQTLTDSEHLPLLCLPPTDPNLPNYGSLAVGSATQEVGACGDEHGSGRCSLSVEICGVFLPTDAVLDSSTPAADLSEQAHTWHRSPRCPLTDTKEERTPRTRYVLFVFLYMG